MTLAPRKELMKIYIAGSLVIVPIFVMVVLATLGYWAMAGLILFFLIAGIGMFYGVQLALTNYRSRKG